jgi:hypothetical protein
MSRMTGIFTDTASAVRRITRGSIGAAVAVAAVLVVAGCVAGAPGYAPYDRGCAFNAYCPQNSGG